MSDSVRDSIYEAIASIRLIDPHTHINPHAPASTTLADLLGYHYYTELAHSAGMPKDQIEEDGLPPRELVGRLVSNLSPIENTAQYRWLVEICRMFFGFDGDRIDASNWEDVYDSAEHQMRLADWPQMVLDQSNVEAVFLTNDFDDELSGFDTDTYIPCLRTDDLVFHLAKLETRQRLAACTGIELDGSLRSLRESLNQRFEHFVGSGARACAISLPPTFEPKQISDGRAATALDEVLQKGPQADPSHQAALSRRVFWTLAELCDDYGLPFDLMIGVNRGVYADGVYQGQDLYDSRVSLIQYRELFNSFPAVKFPISVLASVTNQELVSYAWIFPNVITNGHWWYSNTPSFIARDAAARLEAVPQTKQIAYYSDAYKLEFVWPKFDMYRRVLAGILADHFVKECRWSEERAIELGRQVLRDNVDEIFPRPTKPASSPKVDPLAETWADEDQSPEQKLEQESAEQAARWGDSALAGTSAALAAGAIGMVEVNDATEPETEPGEAELGDTEPNEHDEPETAASGDSEGSDAARHDQGDDGFSTIIFQESSSDQVANESPEDSSAWLTDSGDALTIDDTVPIETVVEESNPEESVLVDESDAELDLQEFDSDQQATADSADEDLELADFPTMLEIDDTVRIEPQPDHDEGGHDDVSDEDSESVETPDGLTGYETLEDTSMNSNGEQPTFAPSLFAEPTLEIDPLPSQDEIQAVDVNDVELSDLAAERSAPDRDTIEAEADSEPLDVGNLLGEDNEPETPGPDIRMLRGEESFEPDEDSLQLQPDPLTGELTFPNPSENPSNQAAETADADEVGETWEEDDLILDAAEDVIPNEDLIDDQDEANVLFEDIDHGEDEIFQNPVTDDQVAGEQAEVPDEQNDSDFLNQ